MASQSLDHSPAVETTVQAPSLHNGDATPAFISCSDRRPHSDNAADDVAGLGWPSKPETLGTVSVSTYVTYVAELILTLAATMFIGKSDGYPPSTAHCSLMCCYRARYSHYAGKG